MFILTKYHKIHETQAEAVSTTSYDTYDSAVKQMYQLMANNVADNTVEVCNIGLFNAGMGLLKKEEYTRYYAPEVVADLEGEVNN